MLPLYPLGDFDQLKKMIDQALDEPDKRRSIAAANREWVLEHHTYEKRLERLLELL
jgi:spore maturation protein CgeB